MTFRGNFIIDTDQLAFVARAERRLLPAGLPLHAVDWASRRAGESIEFFAFFATGLIINAVVQMFFMTNIDELTDLVRTGDLDFLLLKPIDTQFLVSLQRIEWSSLGNFSLRAWASLFTRWRNWATLPSIVQVVLYLVYLLCGIAIYYSLMIALGASTVWLGRNLTLYDFWFYITTFSRYPMEIYSGPWGRPLRLFFTYLHPHADRDQRARPDVGQGFGPGQWRLAGFALVAAVGSVAASRWLFQTALNSYRSASS